MAKSGKTQRHRETKTTDAGEKDSFEAVAKRLECDEDKDRFEAKLGKIAKARTKTGKA